MGSYHSLCLSLVAYHQQGETSNTGARFDLVKVLRVMGKTWPKRSYNQHSHPSSKPLEKETLQALYPADKESFTSLRLVWLSFTAMNTVIFSRYVFRVWQEERLRPDALVVTGISLHRILSMPWNYLVLKIHLTSVWSNYLRNYQEREFSHLSRKLQLPVLPRKFYLMSRELRAISFGIIQPLKPSKRKQHLVVKIASLFNWIMVGGPCVEARLTVLTARKLMSVRSGDHVQFDPVPVSEFL